MQLFLVKSELQIACVINLDKHFFVQTSLCLSPYYLLGQGVKLRRGVISWVARIYSLSNKNDLRIVDK